MIRVVRRWLPHVAITVTDIEILLYVIGGLSIVAFLWSLVDARRRNSRERIQKD